MLPIEKNKLSDYASHTYSFRLYQAPFEEYNTVTTSINGRGIDRSLAGEFSKIGIICETAVTPAQMNNVQINSVRNQQGTMTTNIQFNITEPRDSTLVEQMILARVDMGWEASSYSGLVLELRFIGREDTNEVEDEVAIISYPIIIRKVDISLDQSGTTYHFEAAPSGQFAVVDTYQYQVLNTTFTVSTGNSVSDFFNNYAAMLNEKEEDLVDNETISLPRYIHEFIIDEHYSSEEVGNPKSGTQTSQNQTIHEYNAEDNQVTFPNGSLIISTIDSIMHSIEKARDDLLDGEDDLVYIHEVQPEVVPTEYDNLADRYQYTIKWHIIRTPAIPTVDLDDDDVNILKNRAKLLTNCFKLYDFYFTGTNTEVRSIEWKQNNLYSSKKLAYNQLISRNNNNRSSTGTHNTDTMDTDVEQSRTENSSEDSWSVSASTNDRGENSYYTTDQDLASVVFKQGNPLDLVNTAEADYSTTDVDSNQRLIEYLNQLSWIRNTGGHMTSYINATVKISGDPYWLLPPNPRLSDRSATNTSINTILPLIIIRFFHPSNDYYEGDNFLSARENSIFTGVYKVTSAVTSTFNNGRFEQTLEVARTGISPQDVIDLLAEGGID